jgi:hypothetical protein
MRGIGARELWPAARCVPKVRKRQASALHLRYVLLTEHHSPKENKMATDTLLSKEDFCARFKVHMIKIAGSEPLDDGTIIADYADETAPTYWAEQHKAGESPEECAEADMSYWGEE